MFFLLFYFICPPQDEADDEHVKEDAKRRKLNDEFVAGQTRARARCTVLVWTYLWVCLRVGVSLYHIVTW